MPLRTLTANAFVTVNRLSLYTSGQLRPLVSLRKMVNGELRTVYAAAQSGGGTGGGTGGAFSAVASPDTVTGSANGSGARTVISSPTTVEVSNGTAPFRYAWQITEGSMTIAAPTSATTQFSKTFAGEANAMAQCTVTDALGTVATAFVAITLYTNAGGGPQ